ncbi:uncharacterized protein BDV14DRAFT_193832 [Aspergillus stella-maris]|uniref:uncharacterized protein n=1 Tax=Aspergillus stella-maris TaxID=1810926 RepID=UPI003CCDE2C1
MHRVSKSYTQVLDFWFGPKSSPNYLKQKSFWYGSPEDDAYVRKHLEPSYHEAKDNLLDGWIDTADGEGALALILLLDQVPRNIFPRYAVDKGWHRRLPAVQQRYLYSPFNHSEDLRDQKESLRLFTELGDAYHLRFARDFHDMVQRDGRFKHRDEILGR